MATTAPAEARMPKQPSTLAIICRYGVVVFAWLFLLAVLVQLFLIGGYAFGNADRLQDHQDMGNMIGILTYFPPILGLIGRVGWKLVVQAFVLFIVFHLQYVFAEAGSNWVNSLHAVNAIVMFGIALELGRSVLALARVRRTA